MLIPERKGLHTGGVFLAPGGQEAKSLYSNIDYSGDMVP
jgi:hypothetical protein